MSEPSKPRTRKTPRPNRWRVLTATGDFYCTDEPEIILAFATLAEHRQRFLVFTATNGYNRGHKHFIPFDHVLGIIHVKDGLA